MIRPSVHALSTATVVLIAAGSALLGPDLRAQQSAVVPSAYATKTGGRGFALPFSYGAYLRHQQLVAQTEVPIGVLTGMAFRSRTATTLQNVRERAWQDLRVQLSSSPNTLATMSPIYAQNHGADLMTVFNGKMDLYKRNPNDDLEFNCTIPFSLPFVYVRQGPLCIDLYPQNNGYEFNTNCPQGGNGTGMDFAADPLMRYVQAAKSRTCLNTPPANMAGTGTAVGGYVVEVFLGGGLMPYGRACQGTGQRAPVIASSGGGAAIGNQNFVVEVSGADPNGRQALFMLGADNRMAGGTRLPIDLSAVTPAVNCWQNTDLLIGRFTPLQAGKGSVPTGVPNQSSLRGLLLLCQFAVDDPGIGGFTTTQGGMVRIQ